MRISIRIRNEPLKREQPKYPHIIEVWDENNLNPTTLKLNNYDDWYQLGQHIKSVVISYMEKK
jgi:hypothetical protein